MKEMGATAPEAGTTNTVLMTHFPNIKAALGVQINLAMPRSSSLMGMVALRWWAKFFCGIGRPCEMSTTTSFVTRSIWRSEVEYMRPAADPAASARRSTV
jgi:hypothetical protein